MKVISQIAYYEDIISNRYFFQKVIDITVKRIQINHLLEMPEAAC